MIFLIPQLIRKMDMLQQLLILIIIFFFFLKNYYFICSVKLKHTLMKKKMLFWSRFNTKIPTMKIKYLSFILMFFSITVEAQEQISIKKKGPYTTVSVPKSMSSAYKTPQPAENSEYIKYKIPEFSDDIHFSLYIKEYTDGKEIPDTLSRILSGNVSKENIIFELVPDTSDIKIFELFTYTPGFISYNNKVPNKNSTFKYYQFQKHDEIQFEKETPLLLIYEDDISDSKTEAFIKPLLKNNILTEDAAKKGNLYSKIKRYCIVYYTIKKVTNE